MTIGSRPASYSRASPHLVEPVEQERHPADLALAENAILRFGNRTRLPDTSQSAIDICALSDVSAVAAARGRVGLTSAIFEPDPMCMQIDGAGLVARGEQRIPVAVGVVDRRADRGCSAAR